MGSALENQRQTSVLRCNDPESRKSTSDCLLFWMQNWPSWKPAFSGLFLATCYGSIFDSDRIINACKWLDSTPSAQQDSLGIEVQLEKVAQAAIVCATELGLRIDERISGAIRQLGTKSRNQLLKDLIDLAAVNLDDQQKAIFLKDVHKAYAIRGKFAHSKFEHDNNEEFYDYVRCTQAVEALAFLLLWRELPLDIDYNWGGSSNNFTEYLNWRL